MTNPLLIPFSLPSFSLISPKDVLPAIQFTLADCRAVVKRVIAHHGPFSWENLCQPLAEADNRLSRIWSPIQHLHSVKNSLELRAIHEQAMLLLSEYSTWIKQNKLLYQAYRNLKEGTIFSQLSTPKRKSVENALRDFKLSGVDLSVNKQKRYGALVARLSTLGSIYSNNVLDATMGWSKLITNQDELKGLPDHVLAKVMKQDKEQKNWLLTLDMPTYLPVLTYADNRALRAEMYHAFATRASDQGPNRGKWDNSAVMAEILSLRHELAQLLNFETYADKSLSTKMAKHPQKVINFLSSLANHARPKAERELARLRVFAKQHGGVDELEIWDMMYYSEKQKQHLFSISDEQVRLYFPEQQVIQGLFKVVNRIYGITAKEQNEVDTWHPDVRFFNLFDANGELRGSFYLDLYARKNKRDGAWMDECASNLRKEDGTLQKPVVYLTCNFNCPLGDRPALFTHQEVTTLFHEFGHGLHCMLTKIDISGVSGVSGIPWDAVELPSQFMEKWCWEPEVLLFLSGHYQSGEPLPQKMLNKLLETKNYQSALFILRQVEFSLFDLLVHFKYNPSNKEHILQILEEVKTKVAVAPALTWERFPHTFRHIFTGSYAAGYYSYLWAEALSADAYSRFKDEGIFNAATGKSFLNNILERGGSEDPMILLKRFLGREPKLDSMLRYYGIKESPCK